MTKPSRLTCWKTRAIVFGLLPCALGLGGILYARWDDAVWLTDAGGFWPVTLSLISAAILIKLVFGPFKEATSSVAAWLTLALTWFYAPMWVNAVEVSYAAAVIARDGRVHLASHATRRPEHQIWLLTHQAGNRIVHNVAGKITASRLDLEYRFAEAYIRARRHGEDASRPLAVVMADVARTLAQDTRRAGLAVLTDANARQRLLADICRTAFDNDTPCPVKMTITAEKEAAAPGELWSTQFTETEAIEEIHLPSLLDLLTQSDSPVLDGDKVFRLLLAHARSVAPLVQLAQKSHALDDSQLDELIQRILTAPGCGADVITIIATVNRLSERQRHALRSKALAEADLAILVDNASRLRLSDIEIGALDQRMRSGFAFNPDVAVNALKVLGERLPLETRRAAVAAIAGAAASHALAAIEAMNFSTDLRSQLLAKILDEAKVADFAGWSKERLQRALTRSELRALIAMAVARSEAADDWLEFALGALPVRDMTRAERGGLLNGLLFKTPKAALEFVSKNRDYLDATEVGEVTRDYTRTITPDFCLHLSHRNSNWRTKYFSEAQLQIFRECAGSD